MTDIENHNGGQSSISRRTFLTTATAGIGALAFPMVLGSRNVHAYEMGQNPHPNISPLRVVGLQDDDMTTKKVIRQPWAQQEKAVNTELVQENIDRLACALTEESDERKAWERIFVKPPNKSWSDVEVAIKTNNIMKQHTRSAVMAKVCHVLTDVMGVAADNIHIYDGKHGGSLEKSTPFSGLPDGTVIENDWGGIQTKTDVPGPWEDGNGEAKCVDSLANGQVDILIDIALCKGHGTPFGGFTMCSKNHFGTFTPRNGHRKGKTDYVLCINKSEPILGEQNADGKVLFPRQQLCLVDALWASEGGPGGHPTSQPNALFMGTFGPVVDYQLATKFRQGEMGWGINRGVTDRFLTEFGFKADQLPHDGQIIDALSKT